jgi:hypothetical protein
MTVIFTSTATRDEKASGRSRWQVYDTVGGSVIGEATRWSTDGSWSAVAPDGQNINDPGYGGYSTRKGAADALLLHAIDPERHADIHALYDWDNRVWGEVTVTRGRIALRGEAITEDIGDIVARAIAARFWVNVSPGAIGGSTCVIHISATRFNLRAAPDTRS